MSENPRKRLGKSVVCVALLLYLLTAFDCLPKGPLVAQLFAYYLRSQFFHYSKDYLVYHITFSRWTK